jgi:hypothetical protein
VILQVRPDPGQRPAHGDTGLVEDGLRPKTGALKNRRTTDCTSGQNDLSMGPNLPALPFPQETHPLRCERRRGQTFRPTKPIAISQHHLIDIGTRENR